VAGERGRAWLDIARESFSGFEGKRKEVKKKKDQRGNSVASHRPGEKRNNEDEGYLEVKRREQKGGARISEESC